MKLEVSIQNIQNIKEIQFSVDLANKSLVCITGKNGVGKTTLIKAIKNLVSADTFLKTSSARSFTSHSKIRYKLDENNVVVFKYDNAKKIFDSRDPIPSTLRQEIFIELPIPHGERFNFFQKISEIDPDLRSNIVLNKYYKPTELIDFLQSIYTTEKFKSLIEVHIRKVPYYAILLDEGYYLREDYFSSGEYFLISLYRRIISGYKAIFIDEIDISLDAAAQVRLVEWLRKFKEKYNTTFVFTTHSLAMMKMLDPTELFYMEERDDGSTIAIENRSYAFIKSTLFRFTGWDKYILTEDEVLKDFLEHLISHHCRPSFYQHKIIYVGGGTNTTDLMQRNKTEKFFSKDSESVIVVLDGDQQKLRHSLINNVYCIPIESVEKELLARCLRGEFWDLNKLKKIIDDHERLIDFINGHNKNKKISIIKELIYKLILAIKKSTAFRRKLSIAKGEPVKEKDFNNAAKKLFKHLIKSREATKHEIFEFLIKKNSKGMKELQCKIEGFICLDLDTEQGNSLIEAIPTGAEAIIPPRNLTERSFNMLK